MGFPKMLSVAVALFYFRISLSAPADDGYDRTTLQPLTQFRLQHRKTICGRLCAAAFVQDRQAYTDCTTARSPDGSVGRQWCYVEPQLLSADHQSWNYCSPVTDYDELRQSAAAAFVEKVAELRTTVSKLERAQQKGEAALELFVHACKDKFA